MLILDGEIERRRNVNETRDKKKGASTNQEARRRRDFSVFYGEMRRSLLRVASRYFRNAPHDVEDVVQEAFVKVMETQKSRDIRAPDAYIYAATRNLAISALKKCAYRLNDALGDSTDEAVVSEEPLPDAVFESRERFQLACRAVRELPPKRRRAFVLVRVYGLSYKEVAEQMKISVRTAEAHVARGIVECTEFMNMVESKGRERPDSRPPSRRMDRSVGD